MKEIIHLFTNWSLSNLLYTLLVFAFIIITLEFILSISIQRKRNISSKPLIYLLRILKSLLPFELTYFFLKLIEKPEGSLFPWNLIYNVPALIIMFSGIIISIFMILNLLMQQFSNKNKDDSLNNNLLSISFRGIKITVLFLTFSIFIREIIHLLPLELKNTFTVKSILIINGILIGIIILFVIKKSFKSALKILDQREASNRFKILIKSLSIPVQLMIVAFTIVWFKDLTTDLPAIYTILDKSVYFLYLTSILVFIFRIVEVFGERLSRISVEDTNTLDKTLVEMIRMILRISLILLGIFGVIRIITGKPLTTLLAGLGIGGLALALAAQDTLKNFFGSIMIMTDKPFKIGERVVVKDYDGVIEAIGFRSTRLRTLVGHQVIIPNDQMASNSIENIGRRPHIRRLTNITITYGTSPEKVELALTIIRNILENHEGMSEDFPPRVNFNEFNSDSLNIMMIYWYSPPDYWKFMAFSETVNLRIMKEFNREGIEFAFPTMTTILEQADGQSLHLEMGKKDPSEIFNE